jgi:hypothetical protein
MTFSLPVGTDLTNFKIKMGTMEKAISFIFYFLFFDMIGVPFLMPRYPQPRSTIWISNL